MPTTGDDAKATHCTEDGVYFLDDDGLLFYWCEFSSMWKSYAQRLRKYNIRSLSDIQTIVDQQKLIAELEKERDEYHAMVVYTGGVMEESTGVAGWHLNGDVAEWDELFTTDLYKNAVAQRDIEMKKQVLQDFINSRMGNLQIAGFYSQDAYNAEMAWLMNVKKFAEQLRAEVE